MFLKNISKWETCKLGSFTLEPGKKIETKKLNKADIDTAIAIGLCVLEGKDIEVPTDVEEIKDIEVPTDVEEIKDIEVPTDVEEITEKEAEEETIVKVEDEKTIEEEIKAEAKETVKKAQGKTKKANK